MTTSYNPRYFVITLCTVLLAACGGGGDSEPPAPVAIPQINTSVAFADLFNRLPALASMPAIDGSQTSAKILLGTESSGSFVANSLATVPTISKRVQLQLEDPVTTRLLGQAVWIFYIESATAKLVGVSMGTNYLSYPSCYASTSSSSFPGSTNSKGVWATGYTNGSFDATFRTGKYADYCDYGTHSPANYEWSVEAGTPYPYFCLTSPASLVFPKTKLCFKTDQASKITSSTWVTIYKSTGEVLSEYRAL